MVGDAKWLLARALILANWPPRSGGQLHERRVLSYRISLPLADNLGRGFPLAKFAEIAEELERQFNGVTVYDRKPASGKTRHSTDDIIFEVMTADLDHAWRSSYRA